MEMVSATATRRAVFAMVPNGLAAIANSGIARENTVVDPIDRTIFKGRILASEAAPISRDCI